MDTDQITAKDDEKAAEATTPKPKKAKGKPEPVTPKNGAIAGPSSAQKVVKKRRASRTTLIEGVISSLHAATAMLEILKGELDKEDTDDENKDDK